MTLGRLHKIVLALAVTMSVIGMLEGSPLTATSALVTVAVVLVTVGQLHATTRPIWRTLLVHGATLAGLAFAIVVFQRARIDAVLLVVMLGVVNRFALRASHRDDLIVLGATVVLVAATTTISPGIAFLFILVAFVPLALWGLWTSTLVAAAPHDLGRPVPRQLLRIAVWGIGLMVAGFLAVSLLPRYRFGRIFTTGYFAQLAGASTSMDLRTGGVRPPGGGAPVLQVEPKDPSQSGRVEGLYARLFLLDRFDGRGFSASPPSRLYSVYHRSDLYHGDFRDFEDDEPASTVRIVLERVTHEAARHPVPTLGRDRPSWVKLGSLHRTIAGGWLAGVPRSTSTMVMKVDLDRPAPILPWPSSAAEEARARLLQLPPNLDPRVVGLARELTKDADTVREKVAAIMGHFDRGFTYTLDPLPGTSQDPLVRFLFEAKTGHCELYAGAATVLLRLSGVEAVVATGYYGGRYNDAGGFLEMTEDDAHAWVEVYDPQNGWRWVDGTPATERSRRSTNLLSGVTDLYNALEKFWYDKVVAFDETKRAAMIAAARKKLSGIEDAISGELPDFDGTGAGGFGGVTIAALVVLLALIALVVRWTRTRSISQLGRRLRRALGASIDDNRTLGMLLSAQSPDRRDVAASAVGAYEAWRFGGPGDQTDAAPVADAIRELERRRAPRS